MRIIIKQTEGKNEAKERIKCVAVRTDHEQVKKSEGVCVFLNTDKNQMKLFFMWHFTAFFSQENAGENDFDLVKVHGIIVF